VRTNQGCVFSQNVHRTSLQNIQIFAKNEIFQILARYNRYMHDLNDFWKIMGTTLIICLAIAVLV
jgi:hypothetical protein